MGKKTQLGVIVGSLRKGSYSLRVAKALADRAPSTWAVNFVEIGNLPLYNQDLDVDPPEQWKAFRSTILACDALLFVTPEYNRSIPGVLKNATDIGSRPQGENVFNGLPAAVASTSPYAGGAMAANHALRQSFVYLNLLVMQQPEAYIRSADELFDERGKVDDPEVAKQLGAFMSAFADWVTKLGSKPPEDFKQFMDRREEISVAYINGDAGPLTRISSSEDPVTFFPPGGTRVTGAQSVTNANRQGAKSFGAGSTGRFEILAQGAGPDFAYWTGIQHAEVTLKSKSEVVAMRLRTTEIFRNEGGKWKLIHRHADMIDKDKG